MNRKSGQENVAVVEKWPFNTGRWPLTEVLLYIAVYVTNMQKYMLLRYSSMALKYPEAFF